ncbi:MAG: amino acid racemase [Candidatus Woesearchaeota archaeon]
MIAKELETDDRQKIRIDFGKRLGIVGGLGAETSAKFCLNMNNRFREITNFQPDITMENLPVSIELERSFISDTNSTNHFMLLENAVKRLNKVNVDFIAIPCNTIHLFIDRLKNISKAPIINMIEEVAKECNKIDLNKVGILATSKTINEKLYERKLRKFGIELVIPDEDEQSELSMIILRITNCSIMADDKGKILNIINNMKDKGAKAVILGCTDLPILINRTDSSVKLIDSLEVLENSAITFLTQDN